MAEDNVQAKYGFVRHHIDWKRQNADLQKQIDGRF